MASAPAPKRGLPVWAWILLGLFAAGLCTALTVAGGCMACFAAVDSALEPGELVYTAHAGSCFLDVIYVESDGREVRRTVRGHTDGISNAPWTRDVSLDPGDRYRLSVIPAQSCMREPTCSVTHRGATLCSTTTQRHPDGALSCRCEGTVPRD